MDNRYALEMGRAGYVIANDMCKVKPGESVLITIDSVSDPAPALAVAQAAEALGAKVMLIWHSTPKGYGKVAEARMADGLKAAIPESDVWVEFNTQWLLYSSPWTTAMLNGRTRYLFLGGLDRERVVRCIANLDMELQAQFQNKLVELTRKAKHMRITTPAGTDVEFDNDPTRPILNELDAATPGAHFLTGQMGWAPIEDTINGTIVFDGSFSGGGEAELGVLKAPVRLTVEKGVIKDVQGGAEAKFIAKWLASFNDERMYRMAHISYGFNPGSKLTGLCTEDERVWGCTEWGIGYQGPMFKGSLGDAPTHADGICLNSTVIADGVKFTEEGKVVHPEIEPIAQKIRK
ncbi:MAG: leucyl aminopeptidase [Minisyncoccales bacterium]|jgi:2,5-dihydroxypyridine 5,6-dioxygenase